MKKSAYFLIFLALFTFLLIFWSLTFQNKKLQFFIHGANSWAVCVWITLKIIICLLIRPEIDRNSLSFNLILLKIFSAKFDFFYFSGVAKHAFSVWIDKSILNPEKLNILSERQEKVKVPSDVGRIASVAKFHTTLKADEWKHWVLIYSVYCLCDLIPSKDLNLWSMFVNACHLLCRPAIKRRELEQAHSLLQFYCTQFELMYGKESIVPNMHTMLHIAELVKLFGPIYAFWCFSFER